LRSGAASDHSQALDEVTVLVCAGANSSFPAPCCSTGRLGRIHALVERWNGGSMLTLGIMTVVTMGIIVLIGALFA
jgi:hypothetical protein